MKPRQGGFTFIEVLVAIGIFAVIAIICYTTLNQYLSVTERLEKINTAMGQLQRTFSLIERDFRYMLNRSVRDEYGDVESAFLWSSEQNDGELLRITVSEPSVDIPGTTQIQRISWRIKDGSLYRDRWPVLDRVQDTEAQSALVLTGVSSAQLTHFQWDDVRGVEQSYDNQGDGLPFGAEIILEMDDDLEYRRLFDLANGR